MSRIRYLMIHRRGWYLFILATLVVGTIVIEDGQELLNLSPAHYVELFLFILLLVTIALVMGLLTRIISDEAKTAYLLDLRHQLSLKLAAASDLNELIDGVLKFPPFIAPSIQYTALFVYRPALEQFEQIGEMGLLDKAGALIYLSEPGDGSHNCLINHANQLRQMFAKPLFPKEDLQSSYPAYCLPLTIGLEPIGSLHLILPQGAALSDEQSQVLNNVSTEIAIAIKAALQQQRLIELKAAQAALSERKTLYQDLHDVLSQNLGYLHLKLDQYTYLKTQVSDKSDNHAGCYVPSAELERMRDVTSVSFQIVRGMLNSLHSSTSPDLSNLLNDRSALLPYDLNFDYNFSETGQPRPLSPFLLNNIYFICREAVNNVAKHANATQVEGKLIWGKDDLKIEITDNGQGFDPQAIDTSKHYGLSIMEERAEKMHGRLEIDSVPGAGAIIKISIPLNNDLRESSEDNNGFRPSPTIPTYDKSINKV